MLSPGPTGPAARRKNTDTEGNAANRPVHTKTRDQSPEYILKSWKKNINI